MSVSVRVLGEIAIAYDGIALPLPESLRAVALLGWLAVHGGSRSRSEIASSLWPDVPEPSARNSVRTALWALRRAFGDHADAVFDTSRNRIGLRGVEIDLRRFDELVADDRIDEALALASGELLAGLNDEWAILARDSHRHRVIALLTDRSDRAAADGDAALAITRARQAAEMNPLSETCARLLMRRYDEVGDRSVALAVYTRMVDRLRHELKIAPSEETWKLAEAIRARQQDLSRQPAVTAFKRHGRTGPLVGRDDEVVAVEQAWGTACSGVGGVVIVHGEAGIGKTRLIAELSAKARQDRALVAVGTTANIGPVPYGPWAELGGALVRGLGGIPHDEPFATALAPLLPTLIQPAAPGPPDFEEARLIEGLLNLLEYAAHRKPLLLVLEDMHACDEASAVVLARAARRVHDLRILLVETRRDHPFPPALADAENTARNCGALLAQVGLKRLGDAAIGEIVRDAGVADDDAVCTVVASADGNALLAVEAARAIVRGDTSLAEGLRSTVRAARAHLAMPSRVLCELLAVAGRPLSVNDVRRRAQTGSDAEFDAAFEGAHDAGLLIIVDGVVDFHHALLRDAYYADLPELLRTRLHAAAARDIDHNGEPELAGEAARHLLAAGDGKAAAGLLVRAATHALSLGALTRAEELLAEASQLQPSEAGILLELAGVAAHRGLTVEAQTRFERALAAIEDVDDAVGVATAHIRWAEWNTGPLCRPQVARHSVSIALEVLDTAGVSATRLRLQAQAFMALCEAMAGDPDVCEQLLNGIDAQCSRLPSDPIRDVRRHVARTIARIRQGRFDEVAEAGRAAAAIARSIGRQDLLYGSLVNATAGLAATGEYAHALQLLDEMGLEPGGGTIPMATEAEVQMSRAWLMSRLGRHAEAARVAGSAQRIAERIGSAELVAMADAEIGRVHLRAGSYEEAAALLARALAVDEAAIGRPTARLQRAEALTRLGRIAEAKEELAATVLEPAGQSDWPDTLVARVASVRGLISAAEGDSTVAAHHFDRAAACWRRRIDAADGGERYTAVLADLGRPVIGLMSPTDELDLVLGDIARLETTRRHHAYLR